MAKYDGMTRLLKKQPLRPVQMGFEDVAAVVPGGLPFSAYRYRAWWANQTDGKHVHAVAWMCCGWRVAAVDLPGRVVTFAPVARVGP